MKNVVIGMDFVAYCYLMERLEDFYEDFDRAKAEAMLKDVISYIDSAQTKGVIHKNNASRKVARLNTLLYKAKGEVAQPEVKVEAEVAQEPVAVEEKPAKKTTKRAAKKTEPKAE